MLLIKWGNRKWRGPYRVCVCVWVDDTDKSPLNTHKDTTRINK